MSKAAPSKASAAKPTAAKPTAPKAAVSKTTKSTSSSSASSSSSSSSPSVYSSNTVTAAARPLVAVHKIADASVSSQLSLPTVFLAPIRPDIVHFVHTRSVALSFSVSVFVARVVSLSSSLVIFILPLSLSLLRIGLSIV